MIAIALAGAVQCASAAAVTPAPVIVQAHVMAGRCLSRHSAGGSSVEVAASLNPAAADLVVAPDEILGRFLESGELVEGTAVELGSVPWVLVADGTPPSWRDLERLQPEVWVLGGSAGSQARKALQRIDPSRIHSTADLAVLGSARLALLPASIAPRGTTTTTPVAPLRLRAVLTRKGESSRAAQAALRTMADNARLKQCVTGN